METRSTRCAMTESRSTASRWTALVLLLAAWMVQADPVWAQGATDFAGSVLVVDAEAGKLAVKKADGGTRFTFVVTDKTVYEGGPASLKDIKKGDAVVVTYVVKGPQYVAQKIVKGK